MNLDEAVSALQSLEGERVQASVWGDGPKAAFLMSAEGVLRMMRLDETFPAAPGEEAIVFLVGDENTSFSLWPSRFIEATSDEINVLEVATRDGVLRVYRATGSPRTSEGAVMAAAGEGLPCVLRP